MGASSTPCRTRPARLSPRAGQLFWTGAAPDQNSQNNPMHSRTDPASVAKLSPRNAINTAISPPFLLLRITCNKDWECMVRFPGLASDGAIGKNRPGAAGLMTSFLGWRQAFKSVMSARSQRISRWTRPPRELLPPIPAACPGRRGGRRDRARLSRCLRPICRSKPPSTGPRSTGAASTSADIPATAAVASSAVLTDPAGRRLQRQFQRRHRRRAGRLSMFDIPPACCSASRPI